MQLKCEGCLGVNLCFKMKTSEKSLVTVTLTAILIVNHESIRQVQFPDDITFMLSFASFVGLIDFEYLQFEVMLLFRARTTKNSNTVDCGDRHFLALRRCVTYLSMPQRNTAQG